MSWRIERCCADEGGWECKIEFQTRDAAIDELARYRASTREEWRLRYVRDMIPVDIEGITIMTSRDNFDKDTLDKLDSAFEEELGVGDWESVEVEE